MGSRLCLNEKEWLKVFDLRGTFTLGLSFKVFNEDGMTLKERFDKFDDEFLKFQNVAPTDKQITKRPDLRAFMLLDHLLGGGVDIISCAEHDEIWLDVDVKKLNKLADDDDILLLVRCGVRYDEDVDSLAMFV